MARHASSFDDMIERAWRWRHGKNVLDALALGDDRAILAYCERYAVAPVYANGVLDYRATVIALARGAQAVLLTEGED